MQFIQKLYAYFDTLERAKVYRYIIVSVVGTLLLAGAGLYYVHRTIQSLQSELEEINDLRSSRVQSILRRIEHVKQQRTEVNAILAEDEAFKIGGYLDEKLDLLGIATNKKEETATQVVLDDNYRESVLSVKFAEITMKQLTELLNIIEQNKRIYTKALEITRSTKVPRTIDVSLTIATLQPRTATSE
ncbi:hypothetical protein KJZ61_00260 [Candidatus Dependentiae bacterium]|nr:hypothetical protein [Candidatus Dependentiae bacterium]